MASQITSADILIVTALREEFEAICSKFQDLSSVRFPDSNICYQITRLSSPLLVQTLTVAVMCLYDMGNPSAGVSVTNAIRDLQPSYIFMFGIAGGYKKAGIEVGDVILPTTILYTEPGKVSPNLYQTRYENIRTDSLLLRRMQDHALEHRKSSEYKIEFGVFAVGEKVVADEEQLDHFKIAASKLIGVEMESYGTAYAALAAPSRPRFIAVRGVSDLANKNKNDSDENHRRDLALSNAAEFLFGFLNCENLPRPSNGVTATDEHLIAIRHLSLERRPSITNKLYKDLLHSENIIEFSVDQTAFFDNGTVADPAQAFQLQTNVRDEIDRLLLEYQRSQIAYLGLAHIPFTFHLGYQLGRREITLLEVNRQTGEWYNLDRSGSTIPVYVAGLPDQQINTSGIVVIRASISFPVTQEQISGIGGDVLAVVHMAVENPTPDLITNYEQLNHYSREFRQMLNLIRLQMPHAHTIHLFMAAPPALVFRCGQQIMKTVDPDIVVWNYSNKDNPVYRWGLNISTGQVIDRQNRRTVSHV